MKKTQTFIVLLIAFLLLINGGVLLYGFLSGTFDSLPSSNITISLPKTTPTEAPKNYATPPQSVILPAKDFISQSFNNCGPATLAMILNWHGVTVTQDELGNRMRPYQNATGDNDDKSVFFPEFIKEADRYNMASFHRVNGTEELLKTLVANKIPVMLRTWLHPDEDIGHYRIVRGYDDTAKVFIQDDSYEGPNIHYTYDELMTMWQPFNYEYMIVVPKDKEALVKSILGEEVDELVAHKNSITRAEKELTSNPNNPYPKFNIATSSYYLNDHKKTIELYEEVRNQLPGRMLWYQLEPIQAYQKDKQYDIVFNLTSNILNNNNRGYSELYQIRGESYLEQGNTAAARQEFEFALQYNTYFEPAKEKLNNI